MRKPQLKTLTSFLTPNRVIGMLTLFIGSVFLQPVLIQIYALFPEATKNFTGWKDTIHAFGLLTLPQVMLGFSVVVMSIGVFLQARLAWFFSIILLIFIGSFSLTIAMPLYHVGLLSLIDLMLLLWFWRHFNESSLAAGTLFALVSVSSLILYALCGSLYLGEQFKPEINQLPEALYFATVSMATVGYGDIVPVTSTARMFTVSVIILGITVFATSISAIIGPMIGGNIKRMIEGRISHAMRKNHIIIVGATPLARSVYTGLSERNENVTVIVAPGVAQDYPEKADVIIDDPSTNKALTTAGASKSRYVLVLCNDDAENAFVVLAAKEVVGKDTKIITLVNSDKNLRKMKRVHPDIIFSLQTLASELLLSKLRGETLDNEHIMKLLFQENTPPLS